MRQWRVLHRLMPDCRRGVAAVEFALVAGIVIVMLVAVFDLGLWVWQAMQLEGALIAGVHYAQEFPENSGGITSAIQNALPTGLANATIEPPALSIDCGPGTQAPSGPGGCATPSAQRVFVTLEIIQPFAPLYFTHAQLPQTDLKYVIEVQ